MIQVDILDFDLYKNSYEFYSTYHLANDKTHRIYSDKLTLHVLQLNKEKYATEEDKAYGIDYWARLFKSTTWEELKALTLEYSNLQSTVKTIYRVNADEQARAEILAREKTLLEQRTMQDIMNQKDTTITMQQQALVEKDALILEQAAKIAELESRLATSNQ